MMGHHRNADLPAWPYHDSFTLTTGKRMQMELIRFIYFNILCKLTSNLSDSNEQKDVNRYTCSRFAYLLTYLLRDCTLPRQMTCHPLVFALTKSQLYLCDRHDARYNATYVQHFTISSEWQLTAMRSLYRCVQCAAIYCSC